MNKLIDKHDCIGFIVSFIFASIILVSILMLIIGITTTDPTVIYQGFHDGKKIIVIGANTITYSNIEADLHGYWDNSIIVVYNKKYKKFSSIEPCAIYEKRRLIYYNPLYETNTSPSIKTIGHLIRTTKSNPKGKVASIYGSYLMKGDNNYDSYAIIEVKSNDIKPMKNWTLKDRPRLLSFKKFARIQNSIELHKNEIMLLKKLNRFINCDIPYEPVKIVVTPNLKEMPTSIDEILPYLPANHRYLFETSNLSDLVVLNNIENFNPLDSCYYHADNSIYTSENIKKFASNYFYNKDLEVSICYGYNDQSYPFSFTWILAYEYNSKLLYSFLLNLQD